MSVPRYTFSKEVEPELVNFLKVAEKQKSNKKCNLRSHEVWSKLLPLVRFLKCSTVMIRKTLITGSKLNSEIKRM
jgi:hypothetical protein